MKIKLALLGSLSIISFSVLAQNPWTLSDCIDYAHANNIQIKRTELQAEVAEVNKLQSVTNLFPDLNGRVYRNYGFGRQVDPFTNEMLENNFINDNYSINSSVALFTGLQNYNNMKSSEYAMLAALQNVEKEKIELTLEIASAYLQILYQQELLGVAESQQEVTSLQVERTAKLVEAGSVARGDLLEIQAQLANENLNVTNSQNQLQFSVLNLVQLLDLDSTEGFQIVTPDTVDPSQFDAFSPVAFVYEEALAYLPHIKSAEYDLLSNEKALLVQKGKNYPTLYLSASIYTGYSDQRALYDAQENPLDYPYNDQFRDNIAQSVAIGLSIPIFNRWEVHNSVSKARIQVEDSRYILEQVKLQLYKNIQQAHNDAVSAREKFKSATEAVNSYRESFHYTEQKFNVGLVNSVEYNIGKNNYIKAESELLQAKYEYVFAVKILDFYRGVPISL